MKTVNTFVNKESYTAFSCPYCQRTHRVSVATYKGVRHKLTTTCSCRKQFEVSLNFRQFYRKKVSFTGEVMNVSTGSNTWYAMVVVDLSMTGIRFKLTGAKGIEKNHRLRVNFTLDDQRGANISKEVRVVEISDDHYGCEFLNLAYEEKELGYYLFPG